MKFKDVKIGTLVYNARLGKGSVVKVEANRIITSHNKKVEVWGLDGEGVLGSLHFFESQK